MQKSGDHCHPDEMSGHYLVITDIQVKFLSYLTDGFCKAILTIKETLLPNSLYLHEG
jgi:hypothetical protein